MNLILTKTRIYCLKFDIINLLPIQEKVLKYECCLDEAPKSEESTSESTAAKPEDSCAATANQSTDAPTEDVSQDDKADSKKKPASEKKKRSKSFLKAFTLKKKHDPVPKAEPETVNQTGE